jgi:hypothetical protein
VRDGTRVFSAYELRDGTRTNGVYVWTLRGCIWMNRWLPVQCLGVRVQASDNEPATNDRRAMRSVMSHGNSD